MAGQHAVMAHTVVVLAAVAGSREGKPRRCGGQACSKRAPCRASTNTACASQGTSACFTHSLTWGDGQAGCHRLHLAVIPCDGQPLC